MGSHAQEGGGGGSGLGGGTVSFLISPVCIRRLTQEHAPKRL